MLKLKIDDRPVEVPAGSTILDAAEQLGIDVPTLCFLRGYEPSTSCQVCVVKNRQTGHILPACATQAVEGMVIDSDTDEVHALRRTAFELLLSDHVGDCLAPCYFACPAHMDIPLMLRQIGDRDLKEAIATIKQDIALPAVLGRVCPKPCEKGCRRNAADDPVAVCELKRFVADSDLASDTPFLPACKSDSGKRVAVIGAGPTGLAAAYYLRLDGHQCVLFDDQPTPGGRLLRETTEDQLPRDTLAAEIEQILRLPVTLQTECGVEDEQHLQQIRDEFDAVLMACGAVKPEQVAKWGLKAARRGIDANQDTFETDQPGLFAAGNAIRGKALVVRSVADGKEAAACITQFLAGRSIQRAGKPFSSRIGRPQPDEMPEFLAAGGPAQRDEPSAGSDYSTSDASQQSDRCLACGCAAHGNCKLEHYAALYGADPGRFAGQRRPYEVVGRECSVLFDPGKCIKCELCVQIAANSQEPLGLSFVGRGFDVKLSVPFHGNMDEALTKVAGQCVAACPTAALSFARPAEVVQIDMPSCCAAESNEPTVSLNRS